MGLHACPTSELILDNVKVPKENILGRIGGGANILTQAIEWERCYEFAPHVGVMQRIMEGVYKTGKDENAVWKTDWGVSGGFTQNCGDEDCHRNV